MKRLKKIVLTTDFSSEARKVYPVAARLAEMFEAKIRLVHFANKTAPAYSGISDVTYQQSICQALKDESRLDIFSKVEVAIRRLDRNVSRSLPQFEIEFDHDLLLTAIRKRSGLDHFLLSDTGEEVLAVTQRPVLVYAEHANPNQLSIFSKILVPVVCSEGFSELRPAIRFIAENFDSSFQIIFLEKKESPNRGWLARLFGSRIKEVEIAKSIFEELQKSELSNADSEFVVSQGDPATKIAEHSSQIGASLVLVSPTGFRPNLAKRIIYAGGECSVLKIPTQTSLEIEQQSNQADKENQNQRNNLRVTQTKQLRFLMP